MRRQRVQLAVQPDAVQLRPGEQHVLSITIENPSGGATTVSHLAVRGLPHTWYALGADRVDLSSGDVIHQTLTLHLPSDTEFTPGRYPFRVEVATEADPQAQVTAIVDLRVEAMHESPVIAAFGDAGPLHEGSAPVAKAEPRGPSRHGVSRLRLTVAGIILALLALLVGFFSLPHLRHPAIPERTSRSFAPLIHPPLSPGSRVPLGRPASRYASVAAAAPQIIDRGDSPVLRPRRYVQTQVLFIPSTISITLRGNLQRAKAHLVRLVNLGPRPLTVVRITLSTNAHGLFREHDTCIHHTLAAYTGCTIRLYIQRLPRGQRNARLIIADTATSSPRRVPIIVKP